MPWHPITRANAKPYGPIIDSDSGSTLFLQLASIQPILVYCWLYLVKPEKKPETY